MLALWVPALRDTESLVCVILCLFVGQMDGGRLSPELTACWAAKAKNSGEEDGAANQNAQNIWPLYQLRGNGLSR